MNNSRRKYKKEIDTFDIDWESKLSQLFYIFIGDVKYKVSILKWSEKYIYDIRIFDREFGGNKVFDGAFRPNEHTGKAEFVAVYKMDFGQFTNETDFMNKVYSK